MGTLTLAFNVQPARASGTIYIRADGSIDPPTASISTADNVTYTLTGNVASDTGGIVVERDNIVVDGAGYTLQATWGWGKGIDLFLRSNVTIQNMTIKAFLYGIYLDNSFSNSIVGNNITNNDYGGIWLDSSSNNNSIVENNITNNDYGIYLESSSNNSIVGNMFANDGLVVWYSYGNVVEDNFVNGKPLVCFEGASGVKIENAGQVIVIDCDNINVENLNLSHTSIGIELWNTTNTKITGNNVANNWHGIWLCYSSNNSVVGNNITANNEDGIYLWYSSNNVIYHNNFVNNTQQMFIGTPGYANVWDYGYHSGGNFWSDYNGTDANSNGIGDTPYVIDADNADNYPFMVPTLIPEFPSFLILALFMMATLLAVIIHKQKKGNCAGDDPLNRHLGIF
jgi:parallel beta-helix repeat protein